MNKLRLAVLLVCATLCVSSLNAQRLKGDMNGDGKLTIEDITLLVKAVSEFKYDPSAAEGFVDLGLPSGTLWAKWNVGASSVGEFGDLYAWGDPTGQVGATADPNTLGFPLYHFQSLTSFQIQTSAELLNKHNWYVISGNGSQIWTASDKGITASNKVYDSSSNANHLISAERVIVSPVLDYSAAKAPIVYFDELFEYKDVSQISNLRVYVSRGYTNGSAFVQSQWTDVTTRLKRTRRNSAEYIKQSLDLSDFAGSANVRIAFSYKSTDASENIWSFKNIESCEKNKSICGTEYDLAHVVLGDNWSMPTREQFQELCDEEETIGLKWTLVDDYEGSGVNGWLITAQNGNSLFLPKCGYENSQGLSYKNYYCGYWTGETDNSEGGKYKTQAFYANIDKKMVDPILQVKNMLLPIRAVYNGAYTPTEPVDPGTQPGGEDSGDSSGDEDQSGGSDDPSTPDTPTDPETPSEPEQPETSLAGTPVDLGLPSGILWADVNLGVTNADPYGDFYAWGEVTPSANADVVTKDCLYSTYKFYEMMLNGDPVFTDIGKTISEQSAYDAARVQWGGKWRMPLSYEFDELVDYCTTVLEVQPTGVVGYRFTSKKNGNSIFMPCGGNFGNSIYARDEMGYYWSGSLWTGKVNEGQMGTAFRFDVNTTPYITFLQRYKGCLVRPVMSK